MGRLIEARPGIAALIAITVALWGCGGPAPVDTALPATPAQTLGGPLSTGDQQPTSSTPSGVTPPPPATSDASPSLATSTPFNATTWQALTDFPFGSALEVTSVTATPGGYAAVGFGAVEGETYFGRHQGIVWTSTDGRNWQHNADPAFQFATPEEVAAIGDALYVFGTIEACGLDAPDDCVEVPEAGWAVWRSTADGSWERLPQFGPIQTGGIDGVSVAGGTLVAFGWAGTEAQPTIWYSADGTNWTSTTAVAEMDPVTAVVEAPTGITAFGTVYSDEVDDIRVVTAFSSDGVAFGTVAAPDIVGGTIQSATSGEAGLVAVGELTDPDLNFTGLALHSADGQTWTTATANDGSFDGADILRADGVADAYVALGLLPDPDDFGVSSGQSWTSSDGISWSALAPFGNTFTRVSSSTAGNGGVIAFTVDEQGFEGESVTSTPAAWLLAPI